MQPYLNEKLGINGNQTFISFADQKLFFKNKKLFFGAQKTDFSK